MRGMDAVVHLGAIPSDRDDGATVMQINVMGTWNVLQAAQENGVRRVVFFSSINAQGSVLTGKSNKLPYRPGVDSTMASTR